MVSSSASYPHSIVDGEAFQVEFHDSWMAPFLSVAQDTEVYSSIVAHISVVQSEDTVAHAMATSSATASQTLMEDSAQVWTADSATVDRTYTDQSADNVAETSAIPVTTILVDSVIRATAVDSGVVTHTSIEPALNSLNQTASPPSTTTNSNRIGSITQVLSTPSSVSQSASAESSS